MRGSLCQKYNPSVFTGVLYRCSFYLHTHTYTNTAGSKQICVEPGFDAELIAAPAVSKGITQHV